MKSRSLPLRDYVLLGAPLLVIALVGAFLSNRQKERLAEQHRLESGPLRLAVKNIRSMPHSARGYNFLLRIDASIEGEIDPSWQLSPRKIWLLRAKSAQISTGKTRQASLLANTIEPLKISLPHANVMGIAGLPSPTAPNMRAVALWVMCDAPANNSALDLEIEAALSDAKTHKALGPRVATPVKKLELRAFDFNDDSRNNQKT
ncbi:hypothetical protein EON83_22340 [bacterium]|nr:MAG: hypothetical protein EON83_22340 [bacterium]